MVELLEYQRRLLTDLNRKSEFDEEIIRKYHALIDMEEEDGVREVESEGGEFKITRGYSLKPVERGVLTLIPLNSDRPTIGVARVTFS